jgi:hypothetical protein
MHGCEPTLVDTINEKTMGCCGSPRELCGRRRAEIFKRSQTATEKEQAPLPTHEKARAIRGPGASRKFRFPNYTESRMAVNQILCTGAVLATIVQCKEPANSRIAFPPRAIMAAFRRARSALIQGE